MKMRTPRSANVTGWTATSQPATRPVAYLPPDQLQVTITTPEGESNTIHGKRAQLPYAIIRRIYNQNLPHSWTFSGMSSKPMNRVFGAPAFSIPVTPQPPS